MVSNLSLYRIFLETAKHGSISAAAKHLYVTQPAVSVGIIQLETELGVKLFHRMSRGIKLTQEGEALYEYVSSAINTLENGEKKLRDLSNLDGGILRVGASDMTLKFYLLDHLEKFNREHPKVHLTVSNNPTPKSLEELKKGNIDFCVISEPVKEDSEIAYKKVKTVRDIMVCTPEKYAELGNGTPQDFTTLLNNTVVMLDRETSTRKYEEDWMRKCGVPAELLEPEIELATSDLVVEFAMRGIGIGCIVDQFAKQAIAEGKLKEIPLKHPFPPRSFMIAYLKKTQLGSGARHFISMNEDK